jgi:tRNA pseudouridine55 synthase
MSESFDGLLVLDKPRGITSRDSVDRALRWFPRGTRVGHTGTLDPLASGVLVLCVGVATRLAEHVQQMPKAYETRICLGANTDTDDAEGTITPRDFVSPPSTASIRETLASFVGEIEQVPPSYSAAKVGGRRAYAVARTGREVRIAARRVRVYCLELRSYAYPALELEIECGKGTYVRSLARDIGDRLGCGGYVETLRRTRVGPFKVENCLALDADAQVARAALLPVASAVCQLPAVTLAPEQMVAFCHGRTVQSARPHDGIVAVKDETGTLIGIADSTGTSIHPRKVLRLRNE